MKAADIRTLIGKAPRTTYLVNVPAGNIVQACELVNGPSDVVKALHKGASSHKPDRIVLQQACDLHHLADVLESQEIAEAKAAAEKAAAEEAAKKAAEEAASKPAEQPIENP